MEHLGLGQALALIASFLGGAIFVAVAALRPPPPVAVPIIGEPHSPREIYWPLLLGTGERLFTREQRLSMLRELASSKTDWSIPILLCAREQELDPDLLAAIDAGLPA
ncbi:MAG TPA: hypothetical protein VMW12_01410 [Candidatus Dormibacteraeota bacterium]|nr:hypothetical protein [Candidatus Dormibacteraeota bacterium]